MKLTSSAIEAIKPPAIGQTDYSDQKVAGLILSVSQGGTKTWALRYRRNRQRRRYTLGHWPALGLADARLAARRYLGQVAGGSDPAQALTATKAAPTFADVAREYLERHAIHKRGRGRRGDERMLIHDLLP